MSKMSEMNATIKELRDVASAINDIANWLTSTFGGGDEQPEPQLTFEQVRAILADRSRMGLTAQVRELLLKFGANKLSEVDASSYNQLVTEAKELKLPDPDDAEASEAETGEEGKNG